MVAKTGTRDSGPGQSLFARSAGEGPAVLLLHGLFGAGTNLGALSRHLQSEYRVIALDLPGHGRSPWQPQYDLDSIANRTLCWLDEQHIQRVAVVGHSLGGKVAMQMALEAPERVNSLVVVDIAPVAYRQRHSLVFDALNAVSAAPVTSREQAAAVLRDYIAEEDTLQFLLSSLHKGSGSDYHWRMDVSGLQRDYGALIDAPQTSRCWPGPVVFVKGGSSDYLVPAYRDAISSLFPAAELKELPGCGHWPHVQKPTVFNALVKRFLDRQELSAGELQAVAGDSECN